MRKKKKKKKSMPEIKILKTNEPAHEKMDLLVLRFVVLQMPLDAETCLRAYAGSKGLDQTAHPRSLIRAFAVR